jgi:hypothetical protein
MNETRGLFLTERPSLFAHPDAVLQRTTLLGMPLSQGISRLAEPAPVGLDAPGFFSVGKADLFEMTNAALLVVPRFGNGPGGTATNAGEQLPST